ncbi:hypothetical protein [Streptomyces sp. NPDC101181]|uniref:hypothetical protein n=1 Tax=Streptomyces sp. NPDC101181 TaxID=3366125 RepID=UPI00380A4739
MSGLERDLVADTGRLLERTGHVAPWKENGLTPADLAQHLFDASAGAKYESASLEEYRRRLLVAVRIVTRSTER